MEMWRKLLILMLFAGAGVVISAEISVLLDQTQREEYVPLESSLNLRCHLKINRSSEQCRVFWHVSLIESSPNVSKHLFEKVFIQNTSNRVPTNAGECEGTYSLSNFTKEDVGWYFCKATVEIPAYETVQSSGTHINITTKNLVEHTASPPLVTSKPAGPSEGKPLVEWWMWIIVGASAFVLLVLLVICILLRRCHKLRDPEPIYINTRPMVNRQPSPRADNLKVAPASQHLRTPSPGRRYEESNRRHQR